MTQAQSPGNGMDRGDAEINSAAEFSLASLLNRTHNAMLAAAWALAAAAWEVFPCKWTGPYAKAPMTVNGHLNATMDPDRIKLWWTKWPDAMIGARVPHPCIVIDIDPRNNGSIGALEEFTGPLPATLTVWSGRNDGGCHLYYQRPTGTLTSTRLPEGIDLKVNGYCIVPPSIHPATGQPYRWEEREPATLPHRLKELLRPAPQPVRTYRTVSTGSSAPLIRTVAGAPYRQRNKVLFWASCRAVENGLIDRIVDDLIAAAVSNGLPELEARRTVASARKTFS
jgi:Bifunctional DNA primase/polymerase, N-terminal